MPAEEPTYEDLRNEVAALDRARNARERRLLWPPEQRSIAVARDVDGRLEIFIIGSPLTAVLKIVADVLEYNVWATDDGSPLPASRLVLPRGQHFDQVGAVLCVELIESGLTEDAQAAFSAVEPLIALALSRELAADTTIMGLFGELLLLKNLLLGSPPLLADELVYSWAGSAPSARDFQINSVGVEVKTTQGAASVHHVEGVHQVELGHSNTGGLETHLFLLSLGLVVVDRLEDGVSLPELVDSVLSHIPDPSIRSALLARIKQYGGDAAIGYDHAQDRSKPRYSTRYFSMFERLYDLSDERIRLLSSDQLSALKNIDRGSVTFRIVLENRIRGDQNPIVGWVPLVTRILDATGLPTPPP